MSNESKFKIGDVVVRLGSAKDYTTGRRGEVVELSNLDGNKRRYRVRWLYSREGNAIHQSGDKPGNGIRTWVAERFLAPYAQASHLNANELGHV